MAYNTIDIQRIFYNLNIRAVNKEEYKGKSNIKKRKGKC